MSVFKTRACNQLRQRCEGVQVGSQCLDDGETRACKQLQQRCEGTQAGSQRLDEGDMVVSASADTDF